MTDEQIHLRIEERRRRRELERAERHMAAAVRVLEVELEEFDGEIRQAKTTIDADLRLAHWGRDPEQPPKWNPPGRGGP